MDTTNPMTGSRPIDEEVPVIAYEPYRFDPISEREEMLKYLDDNGYVVVKGVADKDQIQHAKDKFWEWVASINPDIKRGDPSTWDGKAWIASPVNGISSRIHHSEFSWNTRLLPLVKEAFAAVWDTHDLIVSFDAGNVFRPWKRNLNWLTDGGWWHVDQNSTKGPARTGKVCVQGLVTYYDATADTGGLCIIPKSHLHHTEVCTRAPQAKFGSDYVGLSIKTEPLLKSAEGILVCAKAGDLILWDSRTIHCNTPSLNISKVSPVEGEDTHNDIIRLVSYVCMLPFTHATAKVIQTRKEAFIHRIPTSHWPNIEINFTYPSKSPVDITTCSKEQLLLVGYRDTDESSCSLS